RYPHPAVVMKGGGQRRRSRCISTWRGNGPGPLAFGNARATHRRAGRRWQSWREEGKERGSNHPQEGDVLVAVLPVHSVGPRLRRHDCHREPMGKACPCHAGDRRAMLDRLAGGPHLFRGCATSRGFREVASCHMPTGSITTGLCRASLFPDFPVITLCLCGTI